MTQWSQTHFRRLSSHLSRRSFLKSGAIAAAACLVPCVTQASIPQGQAHSPERALTLYNPHTDESLKTVYWLAGDYIGEALTEINHILRDHRANATIEMDPDLFDTLYAIQQTLETRQPLYVISGYRTPATNAYLRRHSDRVSKHSLHMEGKAADIYVPGYDTRLIRRAALTLHRGGVGYYPLSNFVHIDTGRVRNW
jgi:uncharacterized protein YcbK (DUF882 family)